MKQLILIISILALTNPLGYCLTVQGEPKRIHLENHQLTSQFSTAGAASTYEWGCPVSEVVSASTGAEALNIIGQECMAEAKQAASLKPGVFDVINVSIIAPDVYVTEATKGFFLNGTFFVQTIVLEGLKP